MAVIDTYRLHSSPAAYMPNIIAWAINGCAFPEDRPALFNYVSSVFPTVPRAAVEQLLTKAVPYTVEGDAVVFSVEATAPAMPELTCRKCDAVNPLVYFAPVTIEAKGTCVCFDCAKARQWLDANGDLRPDIQL